MSPMEAPPKYVEVEQMEPLLAQSHKPIKTEDIINTFKLLGPGLLDSSEFPVPPSLGISR